MEHDDHGSVWDRPRRGRRGPAPEHSLDQIARAAIDLADADGLGAVTMRAVAAALGTGPASLYRYVRTRGELVDLMVDAANAAEDPEPAPEGDWLAGLLALARRSRMVLLRHPWLLETAETPRPIGPSAVDFMERALAAMAGNEADTRTKFEAIGVLNALVVMLTRAEASSRRVAADWAPAIARAAAEGDRPHLAAALAADRGHGPESAEAAFDRVVSRVLTGLLDPAD